MKYNSFLILIIFNFLFMYCNGQDMNDNNVALEKPYAFSVEPNYGLTQGNDQTDLTDGKKKSGLRFWQDKSTVGWSNKKEIIIDLDLKSDYSINRFLINTARNSKAEVEYPLNCLVFTSLDNKNFEYQGDLMLSVDNDAGDYATKSFQMESNGVVGRYVKLVLMTKSKFVFLDEIEVYGEENKKSILSQEVKSSIQKEKLDSFIEQAQKESVDLRNQFLKVLSERAFLNDIHTPEIKGSNADRISVESLKELQANTSIEIITKQNQLLPKSVVFTPIYNLEALQSFSLKDVNTTSNRSNEEDFKGDAFKFFSLINNSTTDNVKIDFQGVGTGVEIYEILPVAGLNSWGIKDALNPLLNNFVQLKIGENKLFVIINSSNSLIGNLEILNSNDKSLIKTIKFVQSKGFSDSTNDKLHVNVWAYLDKPILKENKDFVIKDLSNSGVDVIVVHSVFIDGFDTKNFTKLKNYLNQFKDLENKKILLFYNFKTNAEKRFDGKVFLDQNWKNNFTKWYKLMQDELSNIGVNNKEVYFYPYDEIMPNEVASFIELAKWGKKNISDFNTFITIVNENTYEVAKYADIVQLSSFLVKDLKIIDNDNIWVYDVLDHSRQRSPYKDYRLMAWRAYYYDLKGIGFWNYSALQTLSDAKYEEILSGNIDYSVLYLDDQGNVLSSLRWKYFVQGITDYSNLKSLEKRKGKEQIKKIVKNVLDNQNDTERADNALRHLTL